MSRAAVRHARDFVCTVATCKDRWMMMHSLTACQGTRAHDWTLTAVCILCMSAMAFCCLIGR